MAQIGTAYVVVDADGPAQNFTTMATALAGETSINTATIEPGNDLTVEVIVVTDALADNPACLTAINNAIAAVGNCQLKPGQAVTYVTQ